MPDVTALIKGFADQVAVVTGASSGIGRAIALELAAQGSALCLIGRDEERLNACAQTARKKNVAVQTFRLDLTDDQEMGRLVSRLLDEHPEIHILVHSSGAWHKGTIETVPVAELDRLYRINLRAPYLLTQGLLPALKSARGQVVFINSTQGLGAAETVGPYAATKHGLKALADSLRKEINADGVRVISFFPGTTATHGSEKIFAQEGKSFQSELLLQPEDVAGMVVNTLSVPRTAEVTDVNIRPMQKTY
ncbi:MAG: SDR family NAD(P)-dependent oxidoreductase [Burkholderiales bacterium]